MENQKIDIDLIELIIIDAIFTLILVFFLFLAIFAPGRNLFALNLPLIFGGVTLPFAGTFGKWLAFLRYNENVKMAELLNVDPYASRWFLFDFGAKGYTWMLRIVSVVTMSFAAYHLVRHIAG